MSIGIYVYMYDVYICLCVYTRPRVTFFSRRSRPPDAQQSQVAANGRAGQPARVCPTHHYGQTPDEVLVVPARVEPGIQARLLLA